MQDVISRRGGEADERLTAPVGGADAGKAATGQRRGADEPFGERAASAEYDTTPATAPGTYTILFLSLLWPPVARFRQTKPL